VVSEAAACPNVRKRWKNDRRRRRADSQAAADGVHCSSLTGQLHLPFSPDSEQQLNDLQTKKLLTFMPSSTLLNGLTPKTRQLGSFRIPKRSTLIMKAAIQFQPSETVLINHVQVIN
jgi:hypothetical protein